MTLADYAQLVYQRCDELAQYSQDPDCMDRRYLSKEHKSANQQVMLWMQQAGMRTWQDEAGNQWGAWPTNKLDAPTLVIGSHLDTVPNGGKYDGILGVLLPIAAVQHLNETGTSLPFNVQIVGFGDEEGTRFGATLLGSRAVSGTWQENWATLVDANGICMAHAMRDFGLDINRVQHSVRANDIHAFLEIHIEQGPVLEAKNLAVGVVTGIAGARRFKCTVAGQAGHAGTVPMSMRQDALAGAAEMILAVEKLATTGKVVATVGKLHCVTGATNVISGCTEFSLDIRNENDDLRDQVFTAIEETLHAIAKRRHLSLNIIQTHSAAGVNCASDMQEKLSRAIKTCGITPFYLSSGAGHDAMAMANICPVGMLFMRCAKGISHHPAEAVAVNDVEQTLAVLLAFLQAYQ
jgi:allantoate deiminase